MVPGGGGRERSCRRSGEEDVGVWALEALVDCSADLFCLVVFPLVLYHSAISASSAFEGFAVLLLISILKHLF
jgi:hypothetical protein